MIFFLSYLTQKNNTKDQTEKYVKLNNEVGGDLQPLWLDEEDIDEKLNDL